MQFLKKIFNKWSRLQYKMFIDLCVTVYLIIPISETKLEEIPFSQTYKEIKLSIRNR